MPKRIKRLFLSADRNNLLIRFGIPHFDQTPDHLKPFIAYALWGVDKKGNCLTHRRADHFETVEKINEKYGSETAMAIAVSLPYFSLIFSTVSK